MWLGKESYEMRKIDFQKKGYLLNLGVIIWNVELTELKEKHIWILQSAKRCIQEE